MLLLVVMNKKNRLKPIRLFLIIGIIAIFISCDFFKPLRDSKRKQKEIKSQIDSLRHEHTKLNKDMESMEHILETIEYSDSVFAIKDSLISNASSQ